MAPGMARLGKGAMGCERTEEAGLGECEEWVSGVGAFTVAGAWVVKVARMSTGLRCAVGAVEAIEGNVDGKVDGSMSCASMSIGLVLETDGLCSVKVDAKADDRWSPKDSRISIGLRWAGGERGMEAGDNEETGKDDEECGKAVIMSIGRSVVVGFMAGRALFSEIRDMCAKSVKTL